MTTLYAPGMTPVAVTPRGFAVLEPGASAALLARIRSLVADGRGLGGVIEALTGAYGASLTAIPAFAVALAEGDGVRVAVRGGFAFEVDAAATERVSGAGVTTWTERVIPEVARVALTTSEEGASAPAEFEIADGVVLAAAIVWDASPASAPSPSAAPAQGADAVGVGGGPAAAGGPLRSSAKRAVAGSPADAGRAAPAPAAPEPTPIDETPAAPEEAPVAPADLPVRGPWSSRAAVPDAPSAPSEGLIDSSAVLSVADAETLLPLDSAMSPPSADAAAPAPGPAEDGVASTTGYDHLWGATVIRSVEDAAVRPDEDEEEDEEGVVASPPVAAPAGDHDGATISLAQARALREAGAGPLRTSAPSAPASPGAAAGIAELSAPVASPLAPPRPPAPGRIRVSTGQVLLLDRTVVIGRRPRSTRVSGTDLPHLVAVDSPQQDISRSHVELRVEGESIVASDLRTTNGTTLLRSGVDPVRLHPGEGTVVVPGDVLDLGDGITVAIEGLS